MSPCRIKYSYGDDYGEVFRRKWTGISEVHGISILKIKINQSNSLCTTLLVGLTFLP
jgi:hypothetical protein